MVLCRRQTNVFSSDAWLILICFQELYSIFMQSESEESIIRIVPLLHCLGLECFYEAKIDCLRHPSRGPESSGISDNLLK